MGNEKVIKIKREGEMGNYPASPPNVWNIVNIVMIRARRVAIIIERNLFIAFHK